MILKDDFIKNKSDTLQLDKYGKPLRVGQSVLIMDKVHNGGSRGSVLTGIIAGFDRNVIVIVDGDDEVGDRELNEEIRFLNDKANKKTRTWKYDWEERTSRGLNYRTTKIVSGHLIGCTEKVREGWRDGTLFEG